MGIVDLGLSIFPETRYIFPCAFIRLYVLFRRCLDIDDCESALLEGVNVKNAFGKKKPIGRQKRCLKGRWLFLTIFILFVLDIILRIFLKVQGTFKFDSNVITIFFNILFTGALAYFAWRQHKLEKTNQKIILYEKRYKVYNASKILIERVESGEQIDTHLINDLREIIRCVLFIFNNDYSLEKYLQELIKNACEMRWERQVIENPNIAPIDDSMKEHMDKEIELSEWFNKQMTLCDQRFEKYLKIEE